MFHRVHFAAVAIVELVAVARRWQTYVARGGLVLALGVTLALVCLSYQSGVLMIGGRLSLREYAEAGTNFAVAVLCVQLALVLFAAPAAAAGAICLDKSRGNLTLLMATDLTAMEFVIGKLFGRLLPVLSLVIVSLPLLFITSLLGGINAELIGGGFIVLAGAAVLCSSIALLMSLYVGRTQEALLLAFFLIFAWLILEPLSKFITALPAAGLIARMIWTTNPFRLLLAPLNPLLGVSINDYLMYIAFAVGMSSICVLWAMVRLRSVVLGQANRPIRVRGARAFHRPRMPVLLEYDPLRWYERYRWRPTLLARTTRFLFVLIALSSVAAAVIVPPMFPGFGDLQYVTCIVLVGISLLLIVIRAVSSLADERSRGSLDILATTPYSTPAILWAKWRAAFAYAPWMLVLPCFVALAACWQKTPPRWWSVPPDQTAENVVNLALVFLQPMACAAMLTSLGLFLAMQMKNFARAVGVAVAIFLAISIGWSVFMQLVGGSNRILVELQMISPLMAVYFLVESLQIYWSPPGITLGAIISTGVYLGGAAYFYIICLIIANRKMGRISRTESRPIPVPGEEVFPDYWKFRKY